MADRKFTDPKAATQEQIDRDADLGMMLGAVLLAQFDGVAPPVAYNAIGNMVSSIFAAVEFEQPQHALEEFDHWVKFTRQHLAGIIKERMQ